MRRQLMGPGAAIVALLLLAACQALPPTAGTPLSPAPETAEGPRSGGVLHYGLTLPVSGIDPHVNASSELGIALNGVYDTLVVQDRDGAFHPSLATRWEISEDGKTYTFELRRGVTFHDGTPFNAAAVVRNLERIVDPATKSQKAIFLLGPFDHAEAAGDFTVKIVLKTPYAPLLDGLSQVYLGMASPAALDRWGDQYQMHQVGTGPFRVRQLPGAADAGDRAQPGLSPGRRRSAATRARPTSTGWSSVSTPTRPRGCPRCSRARPT